MPPSCMVHVVLVVGGRLAALGSPQRRVLGDDSLEATIEREITGHVIHHIPVPAAAIPIVAEPERDLIGSRSPKSDGEGPPRRTGGFDRGTDSVQGDLLAVDVGIPPAHMFLPHSCVSRGAHAADCQDAVLAQRPRLRETSSRVAVPRDHKVLLAVVVVVRVAVVGTVVAVVTIVALVRVRVVVVLVVSELLAVTLVVARVVVVVVGLGVDTLGKVAAVLVGVPRMVVVIVVAVAVMVIVAVVTAVVIMVDAGIVVIMGAGLGVVVMHGMAVIVVVVVVVAVVVVVVAVVAVVVVAAGYV